MSNKKQDFDVLKDKLDKKDFQYLLEEFVVVNMPEIEFRMIFDFSKLLDSKIYRNLCIAYYCVNERLNEIRSTYSNQSVYINRQIELRRAGKKSSCYKLFLRLDLEEWIRLEKNRDKHIYSKAKAYIDRVRSEHNMYGDGYDRELNAITTDSRYRSPWCERTVFCADGNECEFFSCNHHEIYSMEGVWNAGARCNESSIVTISPKKHCNSEEWIETTEPWEIFCEVVRKFRSDLQFKGVAFERAFINFGDWQSQVSHAHINMVLKKQVIELCKNGPSHLRILQYSTKGAIDYRMDSVNKLEKSIYEENSLNQYANTDDQVNKKQYSSLESLSDYFECDFMVPIRAKPSIIRNLLGKKYGKENQIFYDVYY